PDERLAVPGAGGAALRAVAQFRVRRAEVRAARRRRVVAVASRRRPRVEVVRAGKVLPDKFGADHDSVAGYQTSCGLMWKQRNRQDGHGQWEGDAGQQREYQDAEKGRSDLLAEAIEEVGRLQMVALLVRR